jgi:hypothetical protein
MFYFNETITSFKTFERVAAGAVFKFNIERNPIILNAVLPAYVPIYILGMPRGMIKPQIELLLDWASFGKNKN